MDPEPVVRDYLETLEATAAGLDPDRRAELVGDVREHIDLALAEAGRSDETTIREVLDRLGTAEEIVAAELGDAELGDADLVNGGMPSWETPRVNARGPLSVETRALLWLTIGGVVLPFLGPVLGLWTASGSTRWTLAQKRTAALIVFVILIVPFVVLVPMAISGEITWLFTTGGILLPFVPLAGILAAGYLVASSTIQLTVSRKA